MDCKHHPDLKKSNRTIGNNTNTIICGVCGTKQYFKTCLHHNDFPDPICIPNPEWHSCADAFGKNYSRIEPLLSSPSLINPFNTAMLQTPPNVFHSHSSMGVRLMPSSTPCLSKESQDLTKESIHNSKSSMNQSIRKGKSRPGTRPKSRAGHESLEKVNETNAQFVPVPGEPNCCPIQFQQNCWQNYCRFPPCMYHPLAVPVPHYIPVYIPVGSDAESNCEHTPRQTETETETVAQNNENESDDEYEKLAKKLVMEQGLDSDDNEDEETNLDEFVNKFGAEMNDEDDKTVTKSEENNLNRDEKSNSTIPLQNDEDDWSSNEDKNDDWARKNVKTEMNELPLSDSDKYKKNVEDERVFKAFKEENYLNESSRDAEVSKEKKINLDFEEKTIITPSTPIKMSLNEYDYEMDKNGGDNGGSQTESVTESEDGKNSKTRSNDSRINFKQEIDPDDVDRILDTLEGIKSSKKDSLEDLNSGKREEGSEENNDSDDDNSEEKFENSTDIILDSKKSYHEDNEDVYKIINVYKKDISNEDGKDDWLDTEDELLFGVKKESERRDKNIQEERKEDFMKMKNRKEDNHLDCKTYEDGTYSPRASARTKVQDQGSNTQGEKVKNVTNKLIYTAIINKKEEKEKGDVSPFNSPRWRDESKKNTKRTDSKKRWMI